MRGFRGCMEEPLGLSESAELTGRCGAATRGAAFRDSRCAGILARIRLMECLFVRGGALLASVSSRSGAPARFGLR